MPSGIYSNFINHGSNFPDNYDGVITGSNWDSTTKLQDTLSGTWNDPVSDLEVSNGNCRVPNIDWDIEGDPVC